MIKIISRILEVAEEGRGEEVGGTDVYHLVRQCLQRGYHFFLKSE